MSGEGIDMGAAFWTVVRHVAEQDERIVKLEAELERAQQGQMSFMLRVMRELPALREELGEYIDQRADNVGQADQARAALNDLLSD